MSIKSFMRKNKKLVFLEIEFDIPLKSYHRLNFKTYLCREKKKSSYYIYTNYFGQTGLSIQSIPRLEVSKWPWLGLQAMDHLILDLSSAASAS